MAEVFVGAATRVAKELLPRFDVPGPVDPRTMDEAHVAGIGFNRMSFGVQAFNPDVQQAVHRVQSLQLVQRLMQATRAVGVQSMVP